MSEITFLGLTNKCHAVKNQTADTKYSTNPIKNSQLEYDFEQEIQNDTPDIKGFDPNEILEQYEITKDDLQYATGEQLLGLYFEAQYSDDNDYKEHNAMLMTLLSNANSDQIKEFMNAFETATQNDEDWSSNYNFSYDNLGKQLLYMTRAKDLTGIDEYENFMQTVEQNPDLFPSYNEYIGIAYGNQL